MWLFRWGLGGSRIHLFFIILYYAFFREFRVVLWNHADVEKYLCDLFIKDVPCVFMILAPEWIKMIWDLYIIKAFKNSELKSDTRPVEWISLNYNIYTKSDEAILCLQGHRQQIKEDTSSPLTEIVGTSMPNRKSCKYQKCWIGMPTTITLTAHPDNQIATEWVLSPHSSVVEWIILPGGYDGIYTTYQLRMLIINLSSHCRCFQSRWVTG